MQKSHPKMVKPRDKAGECRRREEDWPRSVISFCIMVGVSKTRREQLKKNARVKLARRCKQQRNKANSWHKEQRQSTDDRKQELWTWPHSSCDRTAPQLEMGCSEKGGGPGLKDYDWGQTACDGRSGWGEGGYGGRAPPPPLHPLPPTSVCRAMLMHRVVGEGGGGQKGEGGVVGSFYSL